MVSRILTIAGSDSGGGAGIQADLKTISALGGFGMSVITALTAQNTLGVTGIHEITPEFVAKQIDAVVSDIGIDAVKTGMIPSPELMEVIAGKIKYYSIDRLVVDPVMVAKGGSRLMRPETEASLIRRLVPLALVITPNIPEAEVLAKRKISSGKKAQDAAKAIHQLGVRNVLIKGGHLSGKTATDLLYDGQSFHEFSSERIDTGDTHGTGCVLSAAIAANLGKGLSALDAVGRAKAFLDEAIGSPLRIGSGHGPVNPMAALIRNSGKWECVNALMRAADLLRKNNCGALIPEVQSNLGYALPGASVPGDVAAFPGRIIRFGESIHMLACPEFGASSHIARIILTAMRYDPLYRSAMNIRFSEEIVKICRDLGFKIGSFDRRKEPKNIKDHEGSSLEWGTNAVLGKSAAILDMIFDRGDTGKEPMVRILGRDPAEVVAKALRISEKLSR